MIAFTSTVLSLFVLINANAVKDQTHQEYIQSLHHGVSHAEGPTGLSSSPGLSSQIQDQGSSVVSHDQSHAISSQYGPPSAQYGVPVGGPVFPQSVVPPQSVVAPKSDVPVHFSARAINSQVPTYPYFARAYASPYYSQYSQYSQQVPYQGYAPVHPYSYSATPYAAPSVTPYAASPYQQYPYYVPQYYPGYPYYQASGEIPTVTKQ